MMKTTLTQAFRRVMEETIVVAQVNEVSTLDRHNGQFWKLNLMGGIVGTLDFRSKVVARELQDAANTLYNRGPDDSGVWVSENVGLGHRRLAILDVTPSGHQPMISADGRFVIVFNGGIFNFMELRRSTSRMLKKKSKGKAEFTGRVISLRSYVAEIRCVS